MHISWFTTPVPDRIWLAFFQGAQAKGFGPPFIARSLNLTSTRSPAHLTSKSWLFVPYNSSAEFATLELTSYRPNLHGWILQVVSFYFFSTWPAKAGFFHRQCRISSTDCTSCRPNLFRWISQAALAHLTSKSRIFTPHRIGISNTGWVTSCRPNLFRWILEYQFTSTVTSLYAVSQLVQPESLKKTVLCL